MVRTRDGAHRAWVWTWVLALALACGGTAIAQAPAPVPAESFYGRPQIETAQLSPSGRYLAVLGEVKGARNALSVFDLGEPGKARVLVSYTDVEIGRVQWVHDDWLVYSITDRLRGGGAQTFAPGLFSIARAGGLPRTLVDPTSWVGALEPGRRALEWNHELLFVPQDGSSEVVVGRREYNNVGDMIGVRPLRLDVATGSTRSLARGTPEGAERWMFDAAGEPRVAVVWKGGRRQVHWRGGPEGAWRLLDDSPSLSVPYNLFAVDGDGLWVTVAVGEEATDELRRLDMATGKPAGEALVRTPGFDFRGSRISETPGGRTLGLRVVTDAETTVWFDARMKKVQAAADARLPGRVNHLTCRRCESEDPVVLVYSYSDTDPGRYLLHRPASGSWEPVGPTRRAIDPARMATLDMVRVKARDGLQIPVWITQPRGPRQPRPAVLLVHGGPWVRGATWRWDDDAQFLASRGYVVIEPEFRGSDGYGHRLERAGYKQWGLAMQDDLLDALAWAVREKIVDADRVCIAGASYGGFATLMGLVRDPGVFRCGIAWAALSDPRLMFKWSSRSDIDDDSRTYTLPEMLGDPVKDAALLERSNPLLRAAEIKAPLLLAHGGRDSRVLPENATRLRDALKAAGREPEFVIYPEEGHGWYTTETSVDFAGRVERFLARHLGAR